jgi:ATP-dependent RNA helicase DDX10/DBP4
MDRGKRLVYDDEGNPHEVYELEDEAAFKAKGLPEVQRQKFIEAAREVVETADVEDKAAAKAKKKEKIRKRKERARGDGVADDDDDAGVELEETGEDPLANFLADAQLSDDDEVVEQPKKEKKWFQSDSEDDERSSKKKRKKAKQQVVEEPETLEDMEALAAGLLG